MLTRLAALLFVILFATQARAESLIWVVDFNGDTVSAIRSGTNTVVATVQVGQKPRSLAYDGTSVWCANYNSGTVSRIDAATATVTATITVGTQPMSLLWDSGNSVVWCTNYGGNSVSRINPSTNTVTATISVTKPYALTKDPELNMVWVSTWLGNYDMKKINPSTNTVIDSVSNMYAANSPQAIEWGSYVGTSTRYVCVANYGLSGGAIAFIKPSDGTLVRSRATGTNTNPISLAFENSQAGASGSRVWATCWTSGNLLEVNVGGTQTIAKTMAAGTNPNQIIYTFISGLSYVWATVYGSGTAVQYIDGTNSVTSVNIGTNPQGLVFDGTYVWVANQASGSLTKIDAVTRAVASTISVTGAPTQLTVSTNSFRAFDTLTIGGD